MTVPAPQHAAAPLGPNAATRLLVALFRDSPVPIALVDVRSRRVVKANAALEHLLGHAPQGLEGRALRDLDAGAPDEVESHLLLALACGNPHPRERTWTTAAGRGIPVEVLAARLDGAQGTMLALYVRDTRPDPGRPDARGGDEPGAAGPPGGEMELRAWMAQKHESLGRLATGFAEELEGILGRVLRSAESLQASGVSAAATHAGLGEILGAAREARSLVHELLAYTGRQPVALRTFGLNELIAEHEDALREELPSDIGLLVRPCAGRTLVHADPERMGEILLHLVEHAREAMPDGGYMVIATEEVELDEPFAREHPSTRPGPHVMLAISDTGRGMDEETRRRIFEPFYSTRVQGAGSGMGLATVYGMVKQLGGSIWVTSRPGVGTSFRVYLARVEE